MCSLGNSITQQQLCKLKSNELVGGLRSCNCKFVKYGGINFIYFFCPYTRYLEFLISLRYKQIYFLFNVYLKPVMSLNAEGFQHHLADDLKSCFPDNLLQQILIWIRIN